MHLYDAFQAWHTVHTYHEQQAADSARVSARQQGYSRHLQ